MKPLARDALRIATEIAIGTVIAIGVLVAFAGEAELKIERRDFGYVLFVTGGTSNVQYQVWTPFNNDVSDTNAWYYWRRIYSRDFLLNPEYGEVLIYGTNTSQQPMRFFQIRGTLTD